MIITDKFLFFHRPKTGGTFIVKALAELYNIGEEHSLERGYKTAKRFNSSIGEFIAVGKKHARCSHIDSVWFEAREILSNIRNPLDWYVSGYEFGWWKEEKYWEYYKSIERFEHNYPGFPNLGFEQYMQLEYETWITSWLGLDFSDPDALGRSTLGHINFYSRSPSTTLERIVDGEKARDVVRETTYPVNFLRTHNLNKDLYDYLLQRRYPVEGLQFILNKKRVLPLGKGRTKKQHWKNYYTPELLDLILKKDRLMFDLFPEFLDAL